MRSTPAALNAAFLFAVSFVPLVAQQAGTVSGTVVATESGAPLAGASVVIVGTARSVLTNEKGQYHLSVPAGAHTVRARLIGYEAAEQGVVVPAGQTIIVDFKLTATPLSLNEVVVVGARTSRTAVETPVPVDVITAQEVIETGHTEVAQILATLAPSFNASHQTIADGSDHINPASLRGLGPDQVLVLVNGKRRHPPALVHVNGTFGRGTVGVDLNAIPTAAIERIEVLRDGAAAQYGSDAIAGVINIVLKQQTERLEASSTVGTTPGGTAFGDITDKHDGDQVKADANYGFAIGDRGYFNVTAEYLNRGATNRASTWSGPIFVKPVPGSPAAYTDSLRKIDDDSLATLGLTRAPFTMKVGQAEATFGTAFFNAMVPLSETSEFYSFGGFSSRDGRAGAFYRLPDQEAQVAPQIFPYGMLPYINTAITDRSLSAGVRGTSRGWDVDFSLTNGRNDFQFIIDNTVNASLGAASPTTFDAGRLAFTQTTGNLDLVRPLPIAGLKAVSFVSGAEFRLENYRIEAGDAASWQLGNGGTRKGIDYDTTSTGGAKQPGSQGFPGFQPGNHVDRSRTSLGFYAGLESQLTGRLLVDAGGRYETYSDFGSTINGKLAGRYEIVPNVAVRAAVSTGFRAPSLQQLWFNNISTQFTFVASALTPQNVLTSNNQSRVTRAFGIPDLTQETSVNLSAGITARPRSNLSFTADFYRITIDNRIVITSQFSASSDTVVARILAPFQTQGVTTAQFFTNSIDTRTTGVDLVAAYARGLGRATLTLTGSANFTKTEVRRVNVPQSMADTFRTNLATIRNRILNPEDRNRLEDALPRSKASLSARYSIGRFAGLARATYYGSIEYHHPTNPALDEHFGAKALFDLDLSYELAGGVRLAVGADNLFNTYPDRQVHAVNESFGRFVYSRRVTQFGMNGGFYYARVLLSL
ncbi:MAG: TonB-dependent receptor [Gemmatimonadetes bacterium]|nr:MAG: TonB-dependent receptor [Gemmatimonadota bacterium]